MARGRATEDELAAGIRRVEGLSAVATPEGARRDSPFAVPRAAPAEPVLAAAVASSLPERRRAAPTTEAQRDRAAESPPRPSNAVPDPEPARYTDPVTVPMTAEMRTQANLLAAELQRRRTDRRVRFTSNTIFRVAIETFFEHFELVPGDHVNTEDELRSLIHERLAPGRRVKRASS